MSFRAKHFAYAKCEVEESTFRLLICETVFAGLTELVSRTVHHLARDARILDHSVAVREDPPLLFLVF
jgi:hypothetical protein